MVRIVVHFDEKFSIYHNWNFIKIRIDEINKIMFFQIIAFAINHWYKYSMNQAWVKVASKADHGSLNSVKNW